ncbi:hypothetical protein L7F22_035929 [Adiantum nelumboides]|nr:hypothetical protein [Adiantum nelumboides]
MIEVYRPLVAARFPVESSGAYLFTNFEELGEVIETSRRGQLLRSSDIHELIQQLYPAQLNSLLSSTLIDFGPNAPVILEQYAIISRQLLLKNSQLWIILNEIAESLSIRTGTDITNQSLSEILPVLRELYISRAAERYYAAQLLQGTQELYLQYDRLFALLLFGRGF